MTTCASARTTRLIAPVTIGDGAYTGAGATVRRDVPSGALARNHVPQQVVDGWVVSRRPGSASAKAAQAASADAESAPSPEAEPPTHPDER
ncbi:hypothetical protein GCM10025876_12340 [Demequina litorisediminis]|uniref:Bifunctional protein GlmU n=1 Tax=Demequina litorisediminis TaxID=1849022 RepID=A0ABQ6IBB7_9MICO|nr:hypothetical protein GCM10025876_12340 [Demequina litorisediminis]